MTPAMAALVERMGRELRSHYATLDAVAAGRNGLVFRAAREPGAAPTLAVKVAWTPDARVRLEREAACAARLQHPLIVPVSAVRYGVTQAWVEMPWAGAARIAQLLAAGDVIPVARALHILRDMGMALDHAHERGVLHGALSPSHLLIAADGRCHLTGFVLLSDGNTHPALQPRALGDPAYMAPEQWTDGPLDGRTDQYAAAGIAVQMLTGLERRAGAPGRLAGVRPPDLSRLPALHPGTDPRVFDALRRALLPRPMQRFATMAALLHAVEG